LFHARQRTLLTATHLIFCAFLKRLVERAFSITAAQILPVYPNYRSPPKV
jgi:hypothetical protein